MLSDPDTEKIRNICNSLIGSKIQINFTLTLLNNEKYTEKINNTNIIGDCMENILFPFIKKNIPTFEKGPKQKSPDFYNKEWDWELKCFRHNPCFDISNFNSYINQIEKNLEKKMYKTKYLIFRYKNYDNFVEITDFKLCNVWEIINYTGKYPISLQSKKKMWYNIRPCSFMDMNNNKKTPELFIKQICKAIMESPNKIENRKKIIENIYKQFNKIIEK